ncbi:hypothetical protein BASA83_011245 [Batrachochytrium salamandrivorans]|nr:hypothetical protein BASA83_011245 [Batrachochytrium salamandrivorans]
MRVRVLFAAAMVITSVNAGGSETLTGCFGGSCGSRPRLSRGPPEHESDESRSSELIKKGLANNPIAENTKKELEVQLHSYRTIWVTKGDS